VVSESGCTTASDIAACLRGKSVKDIVSAVPGTFGVFPRLYGPNVDGHVFPDQPLKMIARGDHAAMPVIIGSTTDETMQFVGAVGAVADAAAYGAAIDRVFGSVARGRILATYPAANYPTPRAALVQLTTDAQFTCQSRRVATVLSKAQKQPVYRYLFAHSLENDPEQKALGALHTIEHPFFFPWRGQYRPTPTDLIVQQRLVGYWTRFARTGNPNGGVDPPWSAFSTENDAYLQIGGSTEGQRGPVAAHCDVWDAVAMPWPHL
jgi:para-nitrobenzyl esterase